jgi:hypothetical protein
MDFEVVQQLFVGGVRGNLWFQVEGVRDGACLCPDGKNNNNFWAGHKVTRGCLCERDRWVRA